MYKLIVYDNFVFFLILSQLHFSKLSPRLNWCLSNFGICLHIRIQDAGFLLCKFGVLIINRGGCGVHVIEMVHSIILLMSFQVSTEVAR